MEKLNNEILKDSRYITKSKITRDTLKRMGIPNTVSIKEAKEAFDDCPKASWELVGSPYDKTKQKHVRVVSKHALYKSIIRGF